MTTETDSTVIPQNTPEIDDLKGIKAVSDGEVISDPKKSEVEEPKVEEPKETKPEGDKPKRPGKVERENARLKERLEQLEALVPKQIPADKSEKPSEEGPPKEADFENVLDYLKADRDYAIEQAKKSLKEETQKELTENQTKALIEKKQLDFVEREQAIIKENPEYAETVLELYEDGLITDPMVEYIKFESKAGEKISLYLTQHPDEAETISKLRGKELDRVMWALDQHVNTQPKEQVAERQTKAIAPITPVKVPASTEGPDPTKSQRDFEKWMKAR